MDERLSKIAANVREHDVPKMFPEPEKKRGEREPRLLK